MNFRDRKNTSEHTSVINHTEKELKINSWKNVTLNINVIHAVNLHARLIAQTSNPLLLMLWCQKSKHLIDIRVCYVPWVCSSFSSRRAFSDYLGGKFVSLKNIKLMNFPYACFMIHCKCLCPHLRWKKARKKFQIQQTHFLALCCVRCEPYWIKMKNEMKWE